MSCADLSKGLLAGGCGVKGGIAGLKGVVYLFNFGTFQNFDTLQNVISKKVGDLSITTPTYTFDGKTLTTLTEYPATDVVSVEGATTLNLFKFETFAKSLNGASITINKGTYKNSLIESLPLIIFVKNEQVKEFLNSFVKGARVSAFVLSNNMQEGTASDGSTTLTFRVGEAELWGAKTGLTISAIENTAEMADGVVYNVTLTNEEFGGDDVMPLSLYVDDNGVPSTSLDAKDVLDTFV